MIGKKTTIVGLLGLPLGGYAIYSFFPWTKMTFQHWTIFSFCLFFIAFMFFIVWYAGTPLPEPTKRQKKPKWLR